MKNLRVDRAWILHTRVYSDSKILIDAFCESSGIVSGVYRVPKKHLKPSLFALFAVELTGKGELKTIRSLESVALSSRQAVKLIGSAVYCGLYMNELLLRVLPKEDPYPEIFSCYELTLHKLSVETNPEPALRKFEFELLDDLGYGIEFLKDIEGREIKNTDTCFYTFSCEKGFSELPAEATETPLKISGRDLHQLAIGNFSTADLRSTAKKITRLSLDSLLGGKTLKSRELFYAK